MIAHRLSTIVNSDLICAFKDGQIVERGTHEELMKLEEGVYRTLVLKQSHKDEEEKKEVALEDEGDEEEEGELRQHNVRW